MTFWDFLKTLPAIVLVLLALSVPVSILTIAGVIYWAVSLGMDVKLGDYLVISTVESDNVKGCRELREAYVANSNSVAEQIRSNSERISLYEKSVSAMQSAYADALRFDYEKNRSNVTSYPIEKNIAALRDTQSAVVDVENNLRQQQAVQYQNLVTMCWTVLQTGS